MGNTCNDTIFFCKISLAGKKIEIESRNKHVLALCKNYLDQFEHPDFVIQASQSEIDQEMQNVYGSFLHKKTAEKEIAAECTGIESNVIYRKIADAMLNCETILMHGAAIAVDQKCYVFIAPSGTGKTTQINHWLDCIPGTIVVNGDKPLVNVKTELVYGTPWCGKEGMNSNAAAKLAGIIIVERSKTNSIIPISFKEMLPSLLKQVYIPEEENKKIQAYKLIGQLADVSCYRLLCNINRESAIIAYDGIKKNERNKE